MPPQAATDAALAPNPSQKLGDVWKGMSEEERGHVFNGLSPEQQGKLSGQLKLDPGKYKVAASPQAAAAPKDAATSPTSLPDLWKSMSREERDQVMSGLPAEQQADLLERLGRMGNATGLSAAPEFTKDTMGAILGGHPESDPWIRQKYSDLLYKTARWLPSIGGTVGGIGGGIAGEAIDPAGGGIPGAVTGAAIGGGLGEAGRQGIEHSMGWEDDPLTMDERTTKVSKAMFWQAAAELAGAGLGKALKPTLGKAINKLYFAGRFRVGDRRLVGGGALESVIHDISQEEKAITGAGGKGATTVGDLVNVLDRTKAKIGAEVDAEMWRPVTPGGPALGHVQANTTDIQNSIRSLLTAQPSVVREAAINPAGKSAKYIQMIKDEADKYASASHPWNYFDLADKRIRLNQELAPLYSLPPGEQRVYLLEHPELNIKKKEADAIRDIAYEQMDKAAGHTKIDPRTGQVVGDGTTAKLQGKRGVIMALSTQADQHLEDLATGSRWQKGGPIGANVSTYGTSSGKPGFAIHRLHKLVFRGTPEDAANKRVASAFGHTTGSKVASWLASPAGKEVMAAPIRVMFAPNPPNRPEDQDTGADQDTGDDATPAPGAAPTPLPQVKAEAQQRNPSAPPTPRRYAQTATGPNGHRIGSDDGKQWFDIQTGEQVK